MKGKGRWHEAIIGIVLAAIMLAFVLAAMIGSTGAYSEGGPYNIIEKDMGLKEQKVLIGQDLDFRQGWGSNIVTIYRMKEGSIEWTKKADPDNTLKVGNDWIKDESYYVNFGFDPNKRNRKQWDACFSVTDVDMPLGLKVDDKRVSVGTDLTIDIDGMNLFNNDKVDLVVIGPDGQIKYDAINDQQFTDITVAELVSNFGDRPNSLETSRWAIGTYTFRIRTKPEYACGLEAESEDVAILLTPELTAYLSVPAVALEDDFTVSGTAKGQTEVTILSGPPKGGGGKSLLDKGQTGLSPRKASVSTTDDKYSKKMTVQEDATAGYYDSYVLSSGMDGKWGTTGEEDLEAALNEGYGIPNLTEGIITTKTQGEIDDILTDLVTTTGSDDLMWEGRLKVETPFVGLDPVAAVVAVGEPLVVTGTSNRQEGFWIVVTCKGPEELAPHTVKIENGTFRATFDTTDAVTGEYTVKADDGDGHTDEIVVRIGAVPPLVASIDVSATSPHVANGTDASSVVVTAKDADGNPVVGADIVVVTRLGNDSKAAFNTTDNLDGTYSAFVTSTETGDATVIAEDLTTGVSGRTWVVFESGPVVNITLTATKPRNHKPKNASNVRALAMDAFGNHVPPPQANINIKTDLGTVSPTTIDENGAFIATVTSNDLGTADVTATETETEIDESVQVVFPALSCGSEEDVALVGCTFTAPVNIFVSDPNRALGYYDLKISFDGSIHRFSNVTDGNPNDEFDAPNVEVIDDNTIRIYQTNTISMLSPTGSVDVANITFQVVGVCSAPICMALWDDLPQSLTDTNGILLQSTPNVGEEPKAKEKKKLHLCVHRVDGSGNTDAEIKADIKKAQEIFNAALGNCCAIEISWDKKINKITKKDWKDNIDKDGDGKLDEFTKLGKLTKEEKALLGKNKDSCINVYYVKALKHNCAEAIWPSDFPNDKDKWGVVMGDTEEANPKKEESCKNDVHNDDLAHELGHMLTDSGAHVGDSDNLMDSRVKDGSKLTKEQCKLIMKSQFLN